MEVGHQHQGSDACRQPGHAQSMHLSCMAPNSICSVKCTCTVSLGSSTRSSVQDATQVVDNCLLSTDVQGSSREIACMCIMSCYSSCAQAVMLCAGCQAHLHRKPRVVCQVLSAGRNEGVGQRIAQHQGPRLFQRDEGLQAGEELPPLLPLVLRHGAGAVRIARHLRLAHNGRQCACSRSEDGMASDQHSRLPHDGRQCACSSS